MVTKSFRITDDKGFHLRFSNGVILSTQMGGGNYCENYREPICSHDKPPDYQLPSSDNVEIAIWHEDYPNTWLTPKCHECDPDDDVSGRVPMDKWLKIVDWCRQYKQ